LTDNQRIAWRAWAALNPLHDVFGGSYTASGINAYLGLSVVAADQSLAPVSDPPVSAAPTAVLDAISAVGALSGEIDITWNVAADCDSVDVWVTSAVPAGRQIPKGSYRHNSYTGVATGAVSITGLTPSARYGVLIRGVFDNGQSGPATTFVTLAKV